MATLSEATRTTLGGLCAALGTQVLDIVLAPRGLDVPVAEIVVLDPLDTPGVGIGPDDLVLGVALRGGDDATRETMRAAGAAGAAAVVCKPRDLAPPALAAAEEAGVALLSTPSDAPWGGVFSALRQALRVDPAGALPHVPGATMGDLLTLADATAAIAGGPVTIEDMHGRVLAFSQDGQAADTPRAETVLGRRVPAETMRLLRRHGVIDRLMAEEGVLEVRLPGSAPRRAVAIRADGSVLGAIWVLGDAASASGDVDAALQEAARIAAMHMVRHRLLDDVERRVRGGMVAMLLRGEGETRALLERLGFLPGAGVAVVAVELDGEGEGAGRLERLLDLALVHLQSYRWRAVGAVEGRRLYVLVELESGRPREDAQAAVRRTVEDWLGRARAVAASDLRAGMDDTPGDGIPAARRGADRAVELAPAANRVVTLDEVRGPALLAEIRDFLRGHAMAECRELRTLRTYDREHGTDFVETLRVFLEVQSDAGRAAHRLGIHVNTLRYRVRRLAKLVATDLSDPDARLALEMQLRVDADGPDRRS